MEPADTDARLAVAVDQSPVSMALLTPERRAVLREAADHITRVVRLAEGGDVARRGPGDDPEMLLRDGVGELR